MEADQGHPDDELIAWLGSEETQRTIAQCCGQPLSVKAIDKLRREFGQQRAVALAAQISLRKKAEAKFGKGPWLATDRSLQQATDHLTAAYKATQIPKGLRVWDWCCGIAGESMAFAQRGDLCAVDRDPVLLAMAKHNVSSIRQNTGDRHDATFRCSDVFDQKPPGDAWLNIDPDRRPGDGRTTRPSRMSPPLDQLTPFVNQVAGGSIKLAPATEVDSQECPSCIREWISLGGQCRQQVLWFGNRTHVIRATKILNSGNSCSFEVTQLERCPRSTSCGRYAYDFDPAVRAAGLSESFAHHNDLSSLGGPSSFFTSDALVRHDLCQAFDVLWSGPADLRKLRKTIRDQSWTVNEVKLRGIQWDPRKTQKQLVGVGGDAQVTLLVMRVDRFSLAIIGRRVDDSL